MRMTRLVAVCLAGFATPAFSVSALAQATLFDGWELELERASGRIYVSGVSQAAGLDGERLTRTSRSRDQFNGPIARAFGPGMFERNPQERAQRNYEARVERGLDRTERVHGDAARLREEQRLAREREAYERQERERQRRVEREAREWLRAREARERSEREIVQRDGRMREGWEARERDPLRANRD
jgi:hypothetical protein